MRKKHARGESNACVPWPGVKQHLSHAIGQASTSDWLVRVVSVQMTQRRSMRVVMLGSLLQDRRIFARLPHESVSWRARAKMGRLPTSHLLHQLIEIASFRRVLPQFLLDGCRDVVQLQLRRLALGDKIDPKLVHERVDFLIKLLSHLQGGVAGGGLRAPTLASRHGRLT